MTSSYVKGETGTKVQLGVSCIAQLHCSRVSQVEIPTGPNFILAYDTVMYNA